MRLATPVCILVVAAWSIAAFSLPAAARSTAFAPRPGTSRPEMAQRAAINNARYSSAVISSINLQPGVVTLSGPTAPGDSPKPERTIVVQLTALDAAGQAIVSGKYANPIKVTIYGPASHVLTTATPVLRSPTSEIHFTYNGRFVANPIVVTAVSGHFFAEMEFRPARRGFPGTRAVTFHIPNTHNRNFTRGWDFTARFGGGRAHVVQVDTGSIGIVVPAAVLGPQAIGPGAPGKIEYTSDGKIFLGHHYLTPLRLSVGKVSVTTIPIEVLGVQSAACDPAFPKCRVGGISGLGVMGVGFGRGGSSTTSPPEFHNAFLALKDIVEGGMHPGYTITADSLTLGIGRRSKAGFKLYSLQASASSSGDWQTEAGCFDFPQISSSTAHCGQMLVDTGINSMILALPSAERPPGITVDGKIAQGVEIRIAAPNTARSALSYTFKSADGGATTPTSIRWASGTTPFVNTGRNVIARFDYLFDAGSGKVGFKPSG